jgi:hypothetical protein
MFYRIVYLPSVCVAFPKTTLTRRLADSRNTRLRAVYALSVRRAFPV